MFHTPLPDRAVGILRALYQAPPLDITQLADDLAESPASIRSDLALLLEAELIDRILGPAGRRTFELTPRGEYAISPLPEDAIEPAADD